MDYYGLETKIEAMVDELQGLCSQNGLSNTASEEEVVTTVFLYKFLSDKFVYNIRKFAEDIDETEEELLKNENDELDAFYDEHSQDVYFTPDDTIEALVKKATKDDIADQFDETLERISGYEFNDKFKVQTADGEKLPLFTAVTDKVSRQDRKAFAQNIIRIISQDKFQFNEAFGEGNSFDFYSAIFEYLIKNYNVASGVYAQYFTPQSTSMIISKCLVGKTKLSDHKLYEIADFAAGSGSLILHLANELGKGKIGNRARIYTQDISAKSSRFLRLNLMLNGMVESLDNIVKGDSMLSPAQYNVAHDPSSGYKHFDYITINPPFKLDFSSTRNQIEDTWDDRDRSRFFAGVPSIPPKKKDSMAIYLLFIQHVLWALKDDGKAAVVLPTGFLTSRSGIEKKIRTRLIDKNWLSGVISMPSNIFANTGTNVSVIFIDKARTENDKDVIMIDASKLGEKRKEGKNQRTVLRDSEIKKIIDTYINRETCDDFSVKPTTDEIKEKNYSFSAGQYFEVEIEYVEMTKDEFNKKINIYNENLTSLFAKGNILEMKIKEKLGELKYE
jgi:type I restriction enzyme M protein